MTSTVDIATIAAGFGDLPTLAPVAMKVLQLADDDRASLEDIADVIRTDPGLSGQLLRVANSPMYGMGGEITAISRAAAVLGLRTVKLLSLSFSVVTRPTDGDRAGARIWHHTLASAAVAQTVAAAKHPRLADECFVGGLLGNVGRWALREDTGYAAAYDAAEGWVDAEAERAVGGITSADVTAHILGTWGLPAVLADAVRSTEDPTAADGPVSDIARVLNVANAAGVLLTADEATAPTALETFHAHAAMYLSLDEHSADDLLIDAAPALEDIASMFKADSPTELPVTDLLLRAKDGLARLTLDMVAALSQEENRAAQLADENERLATEAATDALTGLPNRRTFDARMEESIAARLRRPEPSSMGLLMMDLDHFKAVNDTHGHQVGDDVLRGVAARLSLHTRRDEIVARVGGEEFVVILPATHADEIALAAARFCKAIADEPFETSIGPLDVTVSIGVASTATIHTQTATELYEAADAALYDAKKAGRNGYAVADLS